MFKISEKVKEKAWLVKDREPVDEIFFKKAAAELGIHPVVARLLYIRGYHTVDEMKSFLYMESEILCDPFELQDMELAVERIRRAIDSREQITIYGDYDVDGVTAVSTLYLYLKSLGARVSYYIPNRATDGYGVTSAALDTLKESGTSLVITVDTGITANAEVEYAKTLGMEFVITDHHECRTELPLATAVVNPHRPDCKYPFKELAGVGVVFKLICAIEERRSGDTRYTVAERMFREYADLVAIGTIADVMPISNENRLIVSYGLNVIQNNTRPGLLALIDASSMRQDMPREPRFKKKVKITSAYIGYTLAPRINAAGRIRSATIAVELFLAESYERAYEIAVELCDANRYRQNEENQIIKEAFRMIEGMDDLDNTPVIVLDADNWHHGVIGILASRITEKFSRPSILVSFEGGMGKEHSPEDVGKGSGRSIKGMNLVDALCHCTDTLIKFGGHELAAGLSVTRGMLPAFREQINEYARCNLKEEDMVPTLDADIVLDFSDVNIALASALSVLEPYGVGNPVPAFILKGVTVNEMTSISEGKHTRLSLGDGRGSVTAMCFSSPKETLDLYVGERADVLFNLDINEWQGRRSVQLIVRDIRPSRSEREHRTSLVKRFDEIWAGASFSPAENVLPSRDDFSAVYRYILSLHHAGVHTASHREIVSKLNTQEPDRRIGYIKLKIIIKVLIELNIVGIEEENEIYTFSVRYSTTKSDLEKSNLLRRLRLQQKG